MTATTLQRLVDYEHAAVFDKSPVADVVFRLHHPSIASWNIADAVMVATGGATSTTYDLSTYTIASLADQLMADGFQVLDINPAYSRFSAMVLVEGPGDQGTSNGDRMFAYTSLMWVLMNGYAFEIREARAQVVEALKQMVIGTAEGEWLDLWGQLYGVPRADGQTDEEFQKEIPKEVFRIRENGIAIENTIADVASDDVKIYEPWKNIFTIGSSTLSGDDRMQDGHYYQYCIIHPKGRPGTDWTKVLPIVDKNRAAGVIIFQPGYQPVGSGVVYPIESAVVHSGLTRWKGRNVPYNDRALLDYMKIESVSVRNNKMMHTQLRLLPTNPTIYDRHLGWGNFPWLPNIPWDYNDNFVHSGRNRDFRVFGSGCKYQSQTWAKIPNWKQNETWASLNTIIGSIRTRTNQ